MDIPSIIGLVMLAFIGVGGSLVFWGGVQGPAVRAGAKWSWSFLKFLLGLALTLTGVMPLLFWKFRKAFLVVMTALWPHNDIMSDGMGLYLRRFYITPRFKGRKRIFLHYIRLSDTGRAPHDHPWDFTSLILSGGYNEEIYYPKDSLFRMAYGLREHRQGRPGNVLDNKAEHVHMLTLLEPSWTFVVAGPRRRAWGFWELDEHDASKDTWIDQRQYLGKGAEVKSWKEDVQ